MNIFKDPVLLNRKKYSIIFFTWLFSLIVNIIIAILFKQSLDVVKGFALSSLLGSFIIMPLINIVLFIQLYNPICSPKSLKGIVLFFKLFFVIFIIQGIIYFLYSGLLIISPGIAGYLGAISFSLKSQQGK